MLKNISKAAMVIGFSALALMPRTGLAQGAAQYCEGMKNSASMVVCLSKYYDEKKTELAKSFEMIAQSVEPGEVNGFKEAHKIWLSYRDAQCEWEKQNEKSESLKRVKELYCQVRLTEQRKDTMELALSDLENLQAYQGITPRWENVLNDQYGDVYWKANSRMRLDLNCNGRDEIVVLGIQKQAVRPGLMQADQNYVIGVVDNPASGKPSAHIFSIPIPEEKAGVPSTFCQQNVSFIARQSETSNGQCQPGQLEINSKSCGQYAIGWQDNKFILHALPSDIKPENLTDQ